MRPNKADEQIDIAKRDLDRMRDYDSDAAKGMALSSIARALIAIHYDLRALLEKP